MTDTIADPFAQTADTSDPFATADDIKGGGGVWMPRPKPEDLDGRLVAMIPRSFRDDAPVPEDYRKSPDEVRDEYTVDLYVLDGGELKFWYRKAPETDGGEWTDAEHAIPASGIPAEFTGVRIVQAALIGQLRKVDGSQRPILMGVMRRGPQARDRGKLDFAKIATEREAWIAKGRRGSEPRFSWQIDAAISPAQRDTALAWWRSAGITL